MMLIRRVRIPEGLPLTSRETTLGKLVRRGLRCADPPCRETLFVILVLVLGAHALAAEPKSEPEAIERQPYKITAYLAIEPETRIDGRGRGVLLSAWEGLVRRFVGAPWDLTVAADGDGPLTTADLDALDPAAFAEAAARRDKVWVLRVGRAGPGYVLSGREFDTATGKLGTIHRRPAPFVADAPRELFALTREVFAPSALIGERFGKDVGLTIQGAGLEPASPIGRVAAVGAVFQPLRLVAGKEGKTQVIDIPFSYLRVESLEGARAKCSIVSIYSDPLTQRFVRSNRLAALGLQPGRTAMRLRFVTKPDKAPAAGYVLTARPYPDGAPREVGTTDRQGRVVVPPGFADGLVILRLLAGRVEPMVEFPAMPGESALERTIPFDPRPQTVALETELDSIRDTVLDLVAVRARLEARLKARLEGEDWEGLAAGLKEFQRLPARETFAQRLATLKESAARQQAQTKSAILTKTAQAQLAEVESLIERYLEDEAFKAYDDALQQHARAGQPKPVAKPTNK